MSTVAAGSEPLQRRLDVEPPLRGLRPFFVRHGLLFVGFVVTALALAALYVSRKEPVYQVSMGVLAIQAGVPKAPPVVGNPALALTLKELLESDTVATTVAQNLRLERTPAQLLADTHVRFDPGSGVLHVHYLTTDPAEGVQVLDEFGRVFRNLVALRLGLRDRRSIDRAPDQPPIAVSVFEPPHRDPGVVTPKRGPMLALAGVAAFALALVTALARDAVRGRIRNVGDAEAATGVAVAVTLPTDRPGAGARLASSRDPPLALERAHILRSHLELATEAPGPQTVLVTSAARGDGKTTVTGYLAFALALAGHRVTCVDADLRRPRLHRQLNVPDDSLGLGDVLAGLCAIEDAARAVPLPPSLAVRGGGSLRVVPAGRGAHSDGATAGLLELWPELCRDADFVLFDSAPLLAVADAVPLARRCRHTVVVARTGATRTTMLFGVRSMLASLDKTPLALVLTE